MKTLFENWFLIVALLAMVAAIAGGWYTFSKLPKDQQVDAVKHWLLYACMEAEKVLGSKTGLLKLRYVYDLFLGRFPWLAQAITFEYFSTLVDSALEDMRHLLETNKTIKNLVLGSDNIEPAKATIDQ